MSDKITRLPQIRFAGFTDAWEQRKLGELGETYTGLSGKTKDDFGHGEGKFVTYMNVFANTVADSGLTESVEIDMKQNEVKYGDVFFTTSSETPEEVGMSSVWTENSANTYLNSFCFGYRPKEKFDLHYLAFMLRSSNVRKKITFLAQGISRYNISKTKVMDIQVPTPSFEEQKKIGIIFKNLDNLITLHRRKLELLKDTKKSLLQKMFPKDGANVPEIRFAGFTDVWGQRKLESICGKIRNAFVGVATPYYVEDGHFYLESNNVKDGQINRNKQVFINDEFYKKQKNNWLHTGDLVMVQSGHVGHTAVIPEELNNTAAHALIIFSNYREKVDPYFLNYQFQTHKSKKHLGNITTGNTIKHILASEMKNFQVDIPKYEEQKKIGNFFRQLDDTITLHQRELNLLKNLKKSLLQQMFI
ncbi:Type-1 restriction enzyme EcoKI specificity protein [Bacillus safensis]|uniref:restriction endonuclease subunit S n=1 Tax=Bacillus safensis TaxID=561879 RepID=UPI0006A918B1|nr:restriction endonuclease subunit S [Bacillus safensis]CUB17615.1 Type-1 restriction enzyme EcoKI specificity protein [Bacillus safensis]